jgi:hypothetical protein
MIKKVCILFLCISFLYPSLSAQIYQDSYSINSQKDETTISLVLGTVINIKEKNETINCNSLYVFYYTPGIRSKEGGIVKGLQKISFKTTPLFLLYQPGPFGQISYVYGFVKDFKIIEQTI